MRIFLLLCLFLLSGCTRVYDWHQRVTLFVETPAGSVQADTVIKVRKEHSEGRFVMPEARGVRSKAFGEALVLEVTPGRHLFVLLQGMDHLALRTFEDLEELHREDFDDWAHAVQKRGGVSVVPRGAYPRMVTFDDIADPTTVRLVDPEDLAASFGAGVIVRQMTLEITDGATTQGAVEGVLGWLGPYPEPPLVRSKDIFNPTHFGSSVKHGDFIRRQK